MAALKYRFSPSVKTHRSTSQIMFELCLALVAVLLFSLAFYGMEYGSKYVIQILLLLVTSLVTAYIVEALYAMVTKKDLKTHLASSYPYITSLILVLIVTVNTDFYAMIIGTVFAIFIGKLVFGGFGQNIFNPAGVGRVVMLSGFGGSVVADLTTGATPVASINAQGWTVAKGGFETFLSQFGDWTGMLTGWHAGAIGETSFLLLLVLGVILVIRQVIDWRIPSFYLGTILVLGAIIALVSGMDLSYALFHVVSGGVMFAAVFMLTDPVTSPVHPVGRAIYGVGAGLITVVIRLFGNTPGGVVYSILLMNILVPLIDYVLSGNQIKTYKKAMMTLAGVSVVALLIGTISGNALEVHNPEAETTTLVSSEDSGDSKVYTVDAEGFYGINTVKVTISSDGKVESVEIVNFGDSDAEGAPARSESFLSQFVGLDVNSDINVDTKTGATFSSDSILEAVKRAAQEFGGQ